MTQSSPKGIVGIYTDEDGRVIATATDFDYSAPGGYTLLEAQESRIKDRLNREVIAAYCSPIICEAIDYYLAEQIVRKLKGKATFIRIGHDGESK